VLVFDGYNMRGKLLVASPKNNDGGLFEKSVIYILSHTNDNGTMGLIINKPMLINLATLMEEMGQDDVVLNNGQSNIFNGGPVEEQRGFVLFNNSDYDCKDVTIQLDDQLCISCNTDILNDIAEGKGPTRYRIFMGYSGWSTGQLESEIINSDWLVLSGDDASDVIFTHDDNNDDKMWKKCYDKMGINRDFIATFTGVS
jgi:putative transcriptional regulator